MESIDETRTLTAPTPARRRGRSHTALGRFGEEAAAAWLTDRGYRVVDRNWRCPDGELDIVAEHHGWWVAVEVKTRRGTGYGHPVEAVTPRKARRLHRLTLAYDREHPAPRPARRWRVDVLGVLLTPDGGLHYDLLQDVGGGGTW